MQVSFPCLVSTGSYSHISLDKKALTVPSVQWFGWTCAWSFLGPLAIWNDDMPAIDVYMEFFNIVENL